MIVRRMDKFECDIEHHCTLSLQWGIIKSPGINPASCEDGRVIHDEESSYL